LLLSGDCQKKMEALVADCIDAPPHGVKGVKKIQRRGLFLSVRRVFCARLRPFMCVCVMQLHLPLIVGVVVAAEQAGQGRPKKTLLNK